MDYLTKWPEVFAVPNQTAATIANLLVEEIASCHSVPTEIPSDRGKAFLSSLMKEVVKLLGTSTKYYSLSSSDEWFSRAIQPYPHYHVGKNY